MSIPVIVVRKKQPPLGYQQITDLSSAVGLEPRGAIVALIQTEVSPVRWRDDGTDPTALVGMLLPVGDTLEYRGDMNAIRFIQTAGGAILDATFYGPEA